VLENVFRYIEEKGYSAFEAAIEGTREIGMAVMATTLSLVVIFLPVAFMQSIPGRFFKSMALTMSFAIMISLLVSFTLTPMLSSRLFKNVKQRMEGAHKAKSKESWFARVLDGGYTWLLTLSLRHRLIVCLIALAVLGSTALIGRYIGFEFFPKDDQSEFEITFRAPEGSSVNNTMDIARKIATDVRQLPNVQYVLTTLGDGQQRLTNEAKLYIRMTPLAERKMTQFDLMALTRDKVMVKPEYSNLRSMVQIVSPISGGGRMNSDLSFQLLGPDLEKLGQYSEEILKRMKATPGVVDADTSLTLGKPELRARVDRAKAADLGVSISDTAQSLRLLVGGDKVSTYNEGGEQYDVYVRATEDFRTDAGGISQLNVPSTRVGSVGLDSFVKLETGSGPTQIDRSARQRLVLLTANVKPGFTQSQASAAITRAVREMNMPSDYQFTAAGNIKELNRTLRGFGLAFLLSFIFMYIVLAAQFESFLHPVTVLMALPLSLPFALLSLVLARQPMNMFTLLGLLVLFGMVKKNSILQIDHTNGLRAKGMERHEALIQASRDRLRPILMTTIAFVAGMAPLAWSSGPGAGINRSTSVVVIGGQSMCLLLTLLMTPVAYSIFDDWINSPIWGRIAGLFGGMRRKVAAAASALFGALFGTFGR
jgi:HAE1 family hydrophobic/amphiphilic exporter-1